MAAKRIADGLELIGPVELFLIFFGQGNYFVANSATFLFLLVDTHVGSFDKENEIKEAEQAEDTEEAERADLREIVQENRHDYRNAGDAEVDYEIAEADH